MLDQLRLESYGCMIRVSTAVNILGWVWIIIDPLSIIGILWTLPLFSSPSVSAVNIAAGVIMIKIILIMLVILVIAFAHRCRTTCSIVI